MTASVYFRDRDGQPLGGHTTSGDTLFEVVRRAWNWFQDPFWKGPRPTLDTVFEVAGMLEGEAKVWHVRAGRALGAATEPQAAQPQLFDTRPEAL